MTVLLTVPRAVRGPLSVDIPSTAVPTGIVRLAITVNRFAWPAGTDIMQFTLEYSLDGGATWPGGTTGSTNGGVVPYKGNPDSPSAFAFPIPEPQNANRRLRGNVTLNAALDCGVVVEGF